MSKEEGSPEGASVDELDRRLAEAFPDRDFSALTRAEKKALLFGVTYGATWDTLLAARFATEGGRSETTRTPEQVAAVVEHIRQAEGRIRKIIEGPHVVTVVHDSVATEVPDVEVSASFPCTEPSVQNWRPRESARHLDEAALKVAWEDSTFRHLYKACRGDYRQGQSTLNTDTDTDTMPGGAP